MWILTILLLIFILGIIILIHELGHFLWAKKFGVYIYEFSIGMGPILYTKIGKDGIHYNIRAFPIGGFVSMAGEVYEDDGKIPLDKFMCNKPWLQRLLILAAGVIHNFILAIVLLFFLGMIWGPTPIKSTIGTIVPDSAAEKSGLKEGDTIKYINGHKVNSWDSGQIFLFYKNESNVFDFKVERKDGSSENVKVTPTVVEDGETKRNVFGFGIAPNESKGILGNIGFAFQKFGTVIESMALTIGGLFTGNLSLKALSGPVGMYTVVNQSIQYGLSQIIYIIAFLSINVGFLNILPFPAFDGGRIFFMIIEKIRRKKINPKFENVMNTIGFVLLMTLMIYITFQDILNLF